MKIIFTDLDGSLLDHNSYSFDPALEALKRVKELGIPLILCSSKTFAEMEIYSKKLQLKEPFIVENGSAVYFPASVTDVLKLHGLKKDGDYRYMELGVDRVRLIKVFNTIRRKKGFKIRSFSEMGLTQIMEMTSLPKNEAVLAMKRKYTEPFIISEADSARACEIIDEFGSSGFNVVSGGRFFHLMGKTDKGAAVKKTIEIYSSSYSDKIHSIGIGDSENDLPMLSVVDFPALVRKWDGSRIKSKAAEEFYRTDGIGPAGWNEAVLDFLQGKSDNDIQSGGVSK